MPERARPRGEFGGLIFVQHPSATTCEAIATTAAANNKRLISFSFRPALILWVKCAIGLLNPCSVANPAAGRRGISEMKKALPAPKQVQKRA